MDILYLLGALAGVGLVVGLNLLLLGRVRAQLDAGAAEALLGSDVPGFRAQRTIVSASGDSAIVEGEGGALFLVVAVGDKLVSRKLGAASGLRAAVQKGASIEMRFADPTFRRSRFVFADDAAAAEIAGRLQP